MAEKPTSATMQVALNAARANGGKLERWSGGFWTYPGCTARMSGGTLVPDQYFAWGTIQALVTRNFLRPSKTSKPDGHGYIVEVEIVP